MSLSIDELVLLKSWPRQICSVETKRGNPISYVEYRNLCVLEKKNHIGGDIRQAQCDIFSWIPIYISIPCL